jgi:sec-independent protein translocase protein TatB
VQSIGLSRRKRAGLQKKLAKLFIFGPERLPKAISDGARMLRGLRSMARKATTDISHELGTEVNLEDLNPKTFIRERLPRSPG